MKVTGYTCYVTTVFRFRNGIRYFYIPKTQALTMKGFSKQDVKIMYVMYLVHGMLVENCNTVTCQHGNNNGSTAMKILQECCSYTEFYRGRISASQMCF